MLYIQKIEMTPQALDAQNSVQLEEWVSFDSQKHKDIDEDYKISARLLETAVQNSFLRVDKLGRLWVLGPNTEVYPYHIEKDNKHYGLRIPQIASN